MRARSARRDLNDVRRSSTGPALRGPPTAHPSRDFGTRTNGAEVGCWCERTQGKPSQELRARLERQRRRE
jgi:hypothetical protein